MLTEIISYCVCTVTVFDAVFCFTTIENIVLRIAASWLYCSTVS